MHRAKGEVHPEPALLQGRRDSQAPHGPQRQRQLFGVLRRQHSLPGQLQPYTVFAQSGTVTMGRYQNSGTL